MTFRSNLAILSVVFALASPAGAQDQSADKAVTDFQTDFAAAYNRGDVDAMAAAFSESAIRVTPSGGP